MQKLSLEEAIDHIHHGNTVGLSGFTSAGAPRSLAKTLAERAKNSFENGENFKVNIVAGASTCSEIDALLSQYNAIDWRIPYQGDRQLRRAVNSQKVKYIDLHLSQVCDKLRQGIFGDIDIALIEVSEILPNGEIVLSTGVGITPTLCNLAKKIILELRPAALRGLHDLTEISYFSVGTPMNLTRASQRIGAETVKLDLKKVIGFVESNLPVESYAMTPEDKCTQKIGNYIVDFLYNELKCKRITFPDFPIQIGVGNVANAVFQALFSDPNVPVLDMYSELLQDSTIDGLLLDKIRFASGGSLPTSQSSQDKFFKHFAELKNRVLLRPMEITNHPDIIRRLRVISINTALEFDLWGNVNSTHVCGRNVINGIGGAGDFARNAFLSIFATPSIAQEGKISAIVPLCSHIDQVEHDVDVVVTEQGIADLRDKSPLERAELIIENCAHPLFKEELSRCITHQYSAHIPLDMSLALSFHQRFLEKGSML